MKEQITEERGPRFHPSIIVPEVPAGKELHKLHGQPVLLTAREEGESMFGNSRFTERQVAELLSLEKARREKAILDEKVRIETAELTQGLNPRDPNTEALRSALSERPHSALEKQPKDGVLLRPGVAVAIGPGSQV